MAIYKVGIGGNDANSGLTWALRKLTLNGVEDIPVVAGDTVHVGPGTYRELLTVDVSGGAGTPITYIGDYTGKNTDGLGGVVRLTGSDDDITATRVNCITANAKDYRTFRGFNIDLSTSHNINPFALCANWIIDQCYLGDSAQYGIRFSGPGLNNTIKNSYFGRRASTAGIYLYHTSALDDRNFSIENCIFESGSGILSAGIGGVTIKNSVFNNCSYGLFIGLALTAGQTITVNNCIFAGNIIRAVSALNLGEIIEDYNSFYNNTSDRLNVAVGANSNTYPPLFDSRWFFETVK
ncbi:MAG TPA: right-handed parallel beta-helix repeat-containing protein [archaeon]|nr:right-handed parallel beta-helix repeat-containing protein [archaeon]